MRPVEGRSDLAELGDRHHVIGIVRIAPLHACERRLGERRLDTKRRIGVRLGLVSGLSAERQQLLDVSNVLFAQLDALRIGLQI